MLLAERSVERREAKDLSGSLFPRLAAEAAACADICWSADIEGAERCSLMAWAWARASSCFAEESCWEFWERKPLTWLLFKRTKSEYPSTRIVL